MHELMQGVSVDLMGCHKPVEVGLSIPGSCHVVHDYDYFI